MLWLTAAGATAFLLVAAAAVLLASGGEETYRPGEEIEGVTSDLARGLPPDYPRVTFTDVTSRAGISFRHFPGTRTSQLPEDMGSGAAWGDFDSDGFVDLVIANQSGSLDDVERGLRDSPARTTLYRNDGDGTFTDVTAGSGIDFTGIGMAVAWGDYDNDGRIDLILTSYGENHLYRNQGDGAFAEVSRRAGLSGLRGFWAGASWGDYDNDGFLDLYITGYVKYRRIEAPAGHFDVENPASINPSSFAPERNLLYHNNRDGTFSEVAAVAGVADPAGRGLSAAWVDLDEDGWLDLYVANDQSDNAFFRNLGNGAFENLSHEARVADYRSAMGIAVGDWNGDGSQDLFLTHWLAQENALYTNRRRSGAKSSRLAFMDEADRYGLGQASLDFVGWATSFVDYDNDGRPDLFVVNGSTLQKRGDSTRLVAMRNQLFWNRGTAEGFYDVSAVAGAPFHGEQVGRGAAVADFDRDGDLDLFVVNHGGPGLLLRNDGGNRRRWLSVTVRGTRSNRQGIGAVIRVVAGRSVQTRQVGAQSSYLSQNELTETFGLGDLRVADTIEVRWPGGGTDVRTTISANQHITIVQAPAASGAAGAESDRARVQAFWQLLREATTHRVARRTDLAAAAYVRALELNPKHEDALYYLGGSLLELGDYEGAEGAWKRLVVVNPASARTHSQLGRLYMCLDSGASTDLESARRHLDRAHQINKEENGPLLRLGELALLRGELPAARRYMDLVLATHADNAVALFYAGYVSWKTGDTARARAEFRGSTVASTAQRATTTISGEGDTKLGSTALTPAVQRCNQLRSLSENTLGANEGDFVARYRELDRVIRYRSPGNR
jgi:tetratricopeptide (TPR) repeat protein